jgi:peptidoglycan hydrolase-like protein with peptidoglycan-binding domain
MHKLATAALAVALGLAWSTLPAIAADDKTVKEKAVDAKDTVKDKASDAWDKTKEKTSEAWDKTKDKTVETKDKVKDKISGNKTESAEDKAEAARKAQGKDTVGAKIDRGVDKTKAKAREAKDKVSNKMERGDTKNAQQALQAKGYNPGPIDGVYGPRTTAAMRDYQKAEGLKVTGEMDADTRAKLMASGPATTSPSASTTTTTTPSASPSTTPAAPANPSTVGSPSGKAAPPEKVEKK